jgi:tetratricopeptide (TPR) repeat protein
MRFIVALLVCLVSVPAQAAWYKVETDKFIFYGTSPKALQEDALRLERFDALLRQRLGISANSEEVKLSIYVLSTESEVRKVYGPGSKDIAGFYTANESGLLAVVPKSTGDFADVILNHEYAHHLMLHHLNGRYPAWYIEGFAEFLSTVTFKGERANIGLPAMHRAYQLMLESNTPIRTLLGASVSEVDSDQRGNFYGRAWLLTHFLTFNEGRKGQLSSYLKLVADGKPLLDAATTAFGDLEILNRDLLRYQNAKAIHYMSMEVPAARPVVTVTQMEDAFGETIRERVMLRRGTADAERAVIVKELEDSAKTYPSSADIWTQLAEARLDMDDYAGAVAAADKAVAADPKSARALLWKGIALVRQLNDKGSDDPAVWKEARSWIVRANRADTEDPLILFEYYRSFASEGREPTPAAVAGLEKASALMPQAESIRAAYAFEMVKAGKYGLAATYLQPIANSPHGDDAAKAFQAVVATLRAADADKTKKVTLEQIMQQLSDARAAS